MRLKPPTKTTSQSFVNGGGSRRRHWDVILFLCLRGAHGVGSGHNWGLGGRYRGQVGRPLVLMPRETPSSLPAIENMRAAKQAGAIILPPIVAYYARPQSIEAMTDFFVGKVLDVLGVEHQLYRRWGD